MENDKWTEIQANLSAYYKSAGIAVGDFHCLKLSDCLSLVNNQSMYHGSEAHLGKHYGKPFTVAVLSLDRGTGSENIHGRTKEITALRLTGLNPHMRGTLETLKMLFHPLQFGTDIWQHFAMTNTAKCCYKSEGMESLPVGCYKNCAEFAFQELAILSPDIAITQGNNAKAWFVNRVKRLPAKVVVELITQLQEKGFQDIPEIELEKTLLDYLGLVFIQEKQTVVMHSVHPSAKGNHWWNYRKLLAPLSMASRILAGVNDQLEKFRYHS